MLLSTHAQVLNLIESEAKLHNLLECVTLLCSSHFRRAHFDIANGATLVT